MDPASRKMVKAKTRTLYGNVHPELGGEGNAGSSLRRAAVSTGLPLSQAVVFTYLKPTELLSLTPQG